MGGLAIVERFCEMQRPGVWQIIDDGSVTDLYEQLEVSVM
jgi:hypothetical protein